MKAELFSSDFMISFFIFLSAMIIIIVYYQNLQTDIYEADARNDMYSKAINIASLLATTSGYPKYWNSNETSTDYVKIIGLYDSGKFNMTKFEELKKINPQTVRAMMGSGAYNINITLLNVTGDIIQKPSDPSFFYTYPDPSYVYPSSVLPNNADQTLLVKRLGMAYLEGTTIKVIMEVILWA